MCKYKFHDFSFLAITIKGFGDKYQKSTSSILGKIFRKCYTLVMCKILQTYHASEVQNVAYMLHPFQPFICTGDL